MFILNVIIIQLKELDKILIKALNKKLTVENRIAERIAMVIAQLVLHESLYLGYKLPTKDKIGKLITVSKTVMDKTWHILANDYALIETKRSQGTFIKSMLTPEVVKNISKLIKEPDINNYAAKLDRNTVIPFDREFQRRFLITQPWYTNLSGNELREKINPGLIPEFINLLSQTINYPFAKNEVYYTDDYNELIANLSSLLVNTRGKFIVVQPFSKTVQQIAKITRRSTIAIGKDASLCWLDELQALCKTNKVDVVHIGSALFYNSNRRKGEDDCLQLMQLQEQFNFKILMDDRFPGLIDLPFKLRDIVENDNAHVIYLRPVTRADHRLSIINIVAGPAMIIKKLIKKSGTKGQLVEAYTGHALLGLMKSGELEKYERRAYLLADSLVNAAYNFFMTSAFCMEKLIIKKAGWYFTLEPKTGSFPRDIRARLMKSNVHVIDPEIACFETHINGVIIISVAGYQDKNQLIRDIKKVCCAKIMIK